jgi:3-carboxy-cis,cis-muconate cycloisomerase
VLRLFSRRLELREPVVPWHTDRARVAELGSALGIAAGVVARIGLDVILLAQTEVAEVREASAGRSSTMPHKQNPVGSTLTRACARLASGYASVLAASLEQEHERAAGAWQAEWEALSGALAYAGAAADAMAGVMEGLEVDTTRMRASFFLAERLDREEAESLVGAALERSTKSGQSFEDELRSDAQTRLGDEEVARLLDPATRLGSAELFVDRALERYRDSR